MAEMNTRYVNSRKQMIVLDNVNVSTRYFETVDAQFCGMITARRSDAVPIVLFASSNATLNGCKKLIDNAMAERPWEKR